MYGYLFNNGVTVTACIGPYPVPDGFNTCCSISMGWCCTGSCSASPKSQYQSVIVLPLPTLVLLKDVTVFKQFSGNTVKLASTLVITVVSDFTVSFTQPAAEVT
jgi:hypothetical protein